MNINYQIFSIIYLLLLSIQVNNKPSAKYQQEIIIDCNYTLDNATSGIYIPENIKDNLTIVSVEYFSFDNILHRGQIVIHKELEKDIREIFQLIKEKKFPVKQVIPIVKYNWNDSASMKDNNTSAFNYRKVKGTRVLSYHSKGRAIDINPKLNPLIKNSLIIPEGSEYKPEELGTITSSSFLVKAFLKKGWRWGGNWKSLKDYQHFQKK